MMMMILVMMIMIYQAKMQNIKRKCEQHLNEIKRIWNIRVCTTGSKHWGRDDFGTKVTGTTDFTIWRQRLVWFAKLVFCRLFAACYVEQRFVLVRWYVFVQVIFLHNETKRIMWHLHVDFAFFKIPSSACFDMIGCKFGCHVKSYTNHICLYNHQIIFTSSRSIAFNWVLLTDNHSNWTKG